MTTMPAVISHHHHRHVSSSMSILLRCVPGTVVLFCSSALYKVSSHKELFLYVLGIVLADNKLPRFQKKNACPADVTVNDLTQRVDDLENTWIISRANIKFFAEIHRLFTTLYCGLLFFFRQRWDLTVSIT